MRPPGRPLETGEHSRSPRLCVDDLVDEYQKELLEADASDEHMRYLQAHLELDHLRREDEDEIEILLKDLQETSRSVAEFLKNDKVITNLDSADRILRVIHYYARVLSASRQRYSEFIRLTKRVEKQHERFVRLSRTLSQTRANNAAIHQLQEFTSTIPRILALLEPRIDEGTKQQLRARMHEEFRTIPTRALAQNTLAPARSTDTMSAAEADHTLLGRLVQKAAQAATPLEDPRKNMLYLKAFARLMTSLFDTVRETGSALREVQEVLYTVLGGYGICKDGTHGTMDLVLDSYKSLKTVRRIQRGITEFLAELEQYDQDLQDRHARIIELGLVYSEIQLKDQSADQVNLQRHLLRRLHQVLLDVLTPEDITYVQIHLLEQNNTAEHKPLRSQEAPTEAVVLEGKRAQNEPLATAASEEDTPQDKA